VCLRVPAASRGITERSAYGPVTDLAEAGSVVKQKNGHRNRYQARAHLPVPEPGSQQRTAGTSWSEPWTRFSARTGQKALPLYRLLPGQDAGQKQVTR
jgi:hypothetical protein